MAQSVNIPWEKGMDYGSGINSLNGTIPGRAVNPGAISAPTNATGQAVYYNLTKITTLEELNHSIGISIEASGRYGLFSASGKFKYSNETKFNSQSTFLLVRCVVENAFTQCQDPQIRSEASELIRQGKSDVFQTRYGNGFVRGMQVGGEFFAVISITSSSKEEEKSIAASLEANYGVFAKIKGTLDDDTKSKMQKSEVRISTYQRGGSGDEQSFTGDIEKIMERLKVFPATVLHNPVPYEVQVADYTTLVLPDGPNLIDVENQKEALQDYTRIHLQLTSMRNDIEFVQRYPNYFVNPPTSDILNKWQESVTDQIDQLKKRASQCTNDIKECRFFPYKTPDGFIPLQRKESQQAVTVYEKEEYGGKSQELTEGEYDDESGSLFIGNDVISSIKVSGDLIIRLYEHFHCQGRFVDIKADTPNLGTHWKQKTSSAIVYKKGNVPVVRKALIFEDADYHGGFKVIEKGRSNILQPNDMLSSAFVPKGLILRLYEDASYRGDFLELTEDTSMVPEEWNDRASSVLLYEKGEDPRTAVEKALDGASTTAPILQGIGTPKYKKVRG